MGLDTNARQKAFVIDLLEQNRHQKVDWTPDGRVLTYFNFALELSDDPKLIEQMDAWYQEQGWSSQLTIAREMVAIAEGADLTSGDSLMDTFVRCTNRLLTGRITVELRGLFPRSGPAGALRTAALSLIPAPGLADGSMPDASDAAVSSFVSW